MAESGNLSECHMPFFELLKRVCENGKQTARQMQRMILIFIAVIYLQELCAIDIGHLFAV